MLSMLKDNPFVMSPIATTQRLGFSLTFFRSTSLQSAMFVLTSTMQRISFLFASDTSPPTSSRSTAPRSHADESSAITHCLSETLTPATTWLYSFFFSCTVVSSLPSFFRAGSKQQLKIDC